MGSCQAMRRHHRLWAALLLLLCWAMQPGSARAEELPRESADQLEAYDLSQWEPYYDTLPESVRQVWDGAGVADLVERIAAGRGMADYGSLLAGLQDTALHAFRESMGAYTVLIGAALISAVAEIACGGKEKMGETASFLCFGMSAAAVSYALMQQVATARGTIESLTAFMEAATPVMSFSLAAVGSVTLSGAVQPLMMFLSTAVSGFFKSVILPMTVAGGAAVIMGGLTQRMGLAQLHKFIKSAVKWLTGAVFTIYFGIVAIQGLSMGGADSVALRAAKYTFDKSIPIVGSAVSGTLETVLGSTALIKNSVGAAAMLIVVGVAFSPLLQIACAGLACKAIAAFAAPLGDGRVPKLLGDLSEVYNNLFAAVTAVALMFIISVGLVMAVGNG